MIFLKIIKCVAVVIVALLLLGALYQYIATKLDARKYPPIGKLIDIGGYKLHMIDSQFQASKNYDAIMPTVILDSGIGSTTFDWLLVYPEIAKFARVIAYDRAGYGWSDASPLQRTSANIVAELHTMLHNAGVQGPYILVGHSFGGMNVRLFAATYPDEVVGIVLVDAVHESVMDKLPQIFIEFKKWISHRFIASYCGIPRIISDYKSYVYPVEKKNKAVDRLHKTTIEYYRTLYNQLNLMPTSCEQMKAARASLPDVPVIVITEGKRVISEQGPCGSYTSDEVAKINATWLELQADLLTLFPQSKQMIAEHSGHNIPYEQPQIIAVAVEALWRSRVDAVREMIIKL
ncbi:MAG: alpha/beta hydrolase [Candidatus Chromulinivorax sp.]|nr:alpha/beta hydrolase [Candidatus Chromulinivorax sp.]